MGGDILLYYVLLLGAILSYLFVSKVFYSLKINWAASVYVFGVGLMVVFGLGLVTGPVSAFFEGLNNSLVDFVVMIARNVEDLFFLYIVLVSLRAMTGVSYLKAIGAVIVSFFLMGIVTGSIFLGYYYLVVMPGLYDGNYDPGYDFYFNVTERADGTMNMTKAIYYSSGELKQACYVEFPEGWKQIEEKHLDPLSIKTNYTFSEGDLDDVFYNSNKPNLSEFIYFQYGFFVGNGEYGECDKKHTPLWLDKWIFNGTIESTNQTLIGSKQLELCDSKGREGNKTRHDFTAGIRYYDIGFSGFYESPYGQDEDLYYIMNNISCNMGY
ncbi:hypothetical protein HZC08_01850 [Candidatus Micrarchaeota archaeon]|nr:hypothetical protein [Candidatus Micrarchaeota archaeon]